MFKVKPYAHQKEALKLMTGKRYFALAMEMGTGKSCVAIADAARLFQEGAIDSVLITAPNGVHENWRGEFERHCAVPYKFYSARASKALGKAVNNATIYHKNTMVVLSVNHNAFSSNGSMKSITDFLATKHSTLVIVDESDGFKNPSAIRTRNLLDIKPLCAYRRILTGTPVNNSPFDLWAQYTFLDMDILNQKARNYRAAYRAFCAEYGEFLPPVHPLVRSVTRARGYTPMILAQDSNGRPKYRNIDRLTSKIAPHTFRIRKCDCLDLPDKVYHVTHFDLRRDQRAVYEAARKELCVQLNEHKQIPISSKLTLVGKLSQITSGFLNDEEQVPHDICVVADDPKLNELENIVRRATDEGANVIVWCRFQHEIERVVHRLAGMNLFQYHGKIDSDTRERSIAEFNTCPSGAVLVGTAKTGGTGLTLNSASVVVYYSNTYSLRDRLQSEDRCHRIGQTRTVVYHDLVARDTIDTAVLAALQNKGDVASAILENLKGASNESES